ncbi:MAG: hypothetical protein IJL56_01835 [Bacteroidales bacterium]|nr:hypothetical protein [Bacteroidales bacterium]
MKMKHIFAKTSLYAAAALLLALGFTACEDEPDKFVLTDGLPTVHYIRPIDVEAADSLLTGAYMGNGICIVGDNLKSVYKMVFNDQEAVLNNSYITDHTLLVNVPSTIPGEVSDKIYFYNKNGESSTYDFKVLVPGPTIKSMSNEWAPAGSTATLYGDFFINDPNVPLTLTIGGKQAQVKDITKGAVTFVIPDGAPEDKIKVKTIYGETVSSFLYKDSRGMLFTFDNDPHPGNHGWHSQVIETDATALSGNFLRLGDPGVTMSEDGAWNDGNFSFEYWPGDWDDPVTYADSPRLTDFVDFSDWENMALKFELFIPSSNPWSAGSMQIIVGGVDKITGGAAGATDIYGNTLAGANNTFFNGTDLPRGLYTPWSTTGSFDTGDEWVTVTIPYSNFIYRMDGTVAAGSLSAEDFTSLTIFVVSGGLIGTPCQPVIKIDNIRAVPNK